MLKKTTCAGCGEPIDEYLTYVENDSKGNLRHFHTRDNCFINWHNKQKALAELVSARAADHSAADQSAADQQEVSRLSNKVY